MILPIMILLLCGSLLVLTAFLVFDVRRSIKGAIFELGINKEAIAEEAEIEETIPVRRIAGTKQHIKEFLQETAFRNKALFWDNACLDTTNYANDIKLEIEVLKRLRETKVFRDKREVREYKKGVDHKVHDPITARKILRNFYDGSLGLFRQHMTAPVNLISIADAFQTIYERTRDFRQMEDSETWRRDCLKFLLYNYDDGTCFFRLTPYDDEISLSTTFTAFLAFHDYFENEEEDAKKDLVSEPPFQNILKTAETLESLKVTKTHGSTESVGFKENSRNEDPLVCSTFYALRIGLCLFMTSHDYNLEKFPFHEMFNRPSCTGILSFLENCYRNGGFGKSEGRYPNVIHTRYALQTMKHLLLLTPVEIIGRDDIKTFMPSFKPEQTVKFLKGCEDDGGFKVCPGDEFLPAIYSTRLGLKSFTLLEELRKSDNISGNDEYLEELDSFYDEIIPRSRNYVNRCSDGGDLYYGLER